MTIEEQNIITRLSRLSDRCRQLTAELADIEEEQRLLLRRLEKARQTRVAQKAEMSGR